MNRQNKRKKKKTSANKSKEKIFNLSIGMLGITLCSVLIIGLTKENKISALNKEEYNKWLLEEYNEGVVTTFNEKELNVYESATCC